MNPTMPRPSDSKPSSTRQGINGLRMGELRFARGPKLSYSAEGPTGNELLMCAPSRGSGYHGGVPASRPPSWAPVSPMTVAKNSRCECSNWEAAAIRARKGARLAGNPRREHSCREFPAMGYSSGMGRCPPTWGNVRHPRCPALLPDGKVLTSGFGRHGSAERRIAGGKSPA